MDHRELPDSVCEHMLAKAYGWKLEYIRNIDPKTFDEHMSALIVEHRIKAKMSQSTLF